MREHFVCISEFDQLPLDVCIMSPAHPIGIVQIVHGMCEHKERYYDFMNFLNQHGYVCIIHDHRGHGKSIRNIDDLGYFYENGEKGIVEDVHQISLFIKKRYSYLPLYLFGHSMGSLVVRCYLKKYDDLIQGLFVCGSPSFNPAARWGIYFTRILSSMMGEHHRPRLIQKIGFESFNKNFDKSVPNRWICSDLKTVIDYNQDPLCGFTFTTQGFYVLFSLMKNTYSLDNWQVKNTNLPIHFIAGANDPCIITVQKWKGTIDFMKKCGYVHVSSHLFNGMQHEILNEKNHEVVYQHILEVIQSWS